VRVLSLIPSDSRAEAVWVVYIAPETPSRMGWILTWQPGYLLR
jgi:hypothetical protein